MIVLFVIVFDGKLKIENRDKITFKDFKSELRKISLFGWVLVSLMLLFDAGNNLISVENNREQASQYAKDTLRFKTIIDQLNRKAINDSLTIKNLGNLVTNNGLKSDSIKLQIVDNAVEAMEQQKKTIEKEKENTFIHFQNEVEDNLIKVLINYEKNHINGFADTSLFVNSRLTNLYIKKYENISSNRVVLDYLMETSEKIDVVNKYANYVASSKGKSEDRKLDIRMFLANVKVLESYLISIYLRVKDLNSYKEYESLDLDNVLLPKIDRDSLINEFKIEYILKTKQIIN